MRTLALSEETHKELMLIKLQMGYKSVEELERDMISEFKKNKLKQASQYFRSQLKKSGLSFKDFLALSEKARREVADEYSRSS